MQAFPRRAGQPPVEPITFAEALEHLRADSDAGSGDAYIASLIGVAREACEAFTERSLPATPWRLKLDAFTDAIRLYQPPIIAVSAVKYTDQDGVEQLLNPNDYVVDSASEPGWLVPAPGKAWPATQSGAVNAVTIEYTAGYADAVPLPLKQWMLLAIGEMHEMRSGSSERPTVRRGFADALLQPYRMMGL